MEELTVKKNDAVALFEAAGNKTKKVLINLFGEKPFVKDIKERIKTFYDALEYNGETLDQFEARTKNDSPDEVGYKKLKAIVLALNEGERMDYKDVKIYKWYPWFNAAGSGSGFSYDDFSYDGTSSDVGARLCLKSKDLAIYAGKQFTDEYNEYINL